MKKLLIALTFLTSTAASANTFDFSACGLDWRIEHNNYEELVKLMYVDKATGKWVWTVLTETFELERGELTVDEFMDSFIVKANERVIKECDVAGGDIPTDWSGYLSYTIKNRLTFNSATKEVSKVD